MGKAERAGFRGVGDTIELFLFGASVTAFSPIVVGLN